MDQKIIELEQKIDDLKKLLQEQAVRYNALLMTEVSTLVKMINDAKK